MNPRYVSGMPATSVNPELATAALSKLGSLPDPVQKEKHTRLLLTAWTVYPPEKSGSILITAVLPKPGIPSYVPGPSRFISRAKFW